MRFHAHVMDTPIDRMVAVVDDDGAVRQLVFLGDRSAEQQVASFGADVEWSAARCAHVAEAVRRWFGGERDAFDALELRPAGSEFSQLVWAEVRRIPYGATASYGEIAARLGRPDASRAVGRANGANPICLAIPCHRVVGSDGSLTGYGGGLATKQALLALESGQLSLGLA